MIRHSADPLGQFVMLLEDSPIDDGMGSERRKGYIVSYNLIRPVTDGCRIIE